MRRCAVGVGAVAVVVRWRLWSCAVPRRARARAFGCRGIPFVDGMRDHGCARNIRSTVHHPEYPSLDVAEYKTGSGETVGDIRDLPAQLIRLA